MGTTFAQRLMYVGPVVAPVGHKSAVFAFIQQPWLHQLHLFHKLPIYLPSMNHTLEVHKNSKEKKDEVAMIAAASQYLLEVSNFTDVL
jgi:hypothetical protein